MKKDFIENYRKINEKWKRTVNYNGLQTTDLAYKSYFFSRVAH